MYFRGVEGILDIVTLEETTEVGQLELISHGRSMEGDIKAADKQFGERVGLLEGVTSSLLMEVTLNSSYLFKLQLFQFDEST